MTPRGRLSSLPHLERFTVYDCIDKRGQSVIVSRRFSHNRPYGRGVISFEAASERISEQLFGHGRDEFATVAGQENLLQFRRAVEFRSVRQLARSVDHHSGVLRAPTSDGVVILQREPDWVHAGVAGGADRIGAVRVHLFAQAQQPSVLAARLQIGHVWRRRRRRRAEQVFKNPFAPLDYRRAVRVRGYGQDAALPQQPAAVRIAQRDAAELRAVDAANAVMFGQSLIQESVVRVQQIEGAAVLAQDALEEELSFATEGLSQSLVEVGEDVGIGRDGLQISEVQPLPAEIADEGLRAWVVEHAARLLSQDERVFQFALFGQIQKLVVRDAAPQEEGEARGEFKIVQAIGRARRGGLRIALDAEEEIGRDQHRFNRALDAVIEIAFAPPAFIKRQQRVQVRVRHGTPERAPG